MRLVNARRILWKSKPDSKKVGVCFRPSCQQGFHQAMYRRTNGESKSQATKQMRPGPAIQAASFVDLSRFPPHREARRDDGTGPTALPGECHFYQYELQNAIRRIAFHNLCGSQRPNLFKEQEVEKAAMPGQPARVRTRSGMSPTIHSRESPACHWLCRNHPATLRSSHAFTGDHSAAGRGGPQ